MPQPRGPITTTSTTAAAAATASASPFLRPEATATPPAYGLVVGLGDPVSDILVRLEDESLASRVFTTCGRAEGSSSHLSPHNSYSHVNSLVCITSRPLIPTHRTHRSYTRQSSPYTRSSAHNG